MTQTGKRKPRPRATSIDVAKRAGVSQSTVSIVLSGKHKGRVGAATVLRVQEACRVLGYSPRVAAQRLRQGRAATVAIEIPQLSFSFFEEVLSGAQETADAHDIIVIAVVTNNDRFKQEDVTNVMTSHDLDGVLLCAVETPDQAAIERFGRYMVALEDDVVGIPSVLFNHDQAAALILDHLSQLGHRRIGHLGGIASKGCYKMRRAALQRAIADRQLELVGYKPVATREISTAAGLPGALSLLALDPRPTAIVCDDAVLASSVYAAAETLGLRIPHDLSVISSHNDALGRVLRPSLTAINLPASTLGMVGMSNLAAAVAGDPTEDRVVLPVSLDIRSSVAAAPPEETP